MLPSAFTLGGCHGNNSYEEVIDLPEPYCDLDETEITGIMSRMTLRQKIAQMYIVGVAVYPWEEVEETRHLIEDLEVGGVYVQPMSGLGFSPEWTAENMNRLQAMAMSGDAAIPVLVTVDQEGGIPQSSNNVTGGTDQPGNLGLGASFDPNNTYRSYAIMAEELSAVGVHVDFAPVLGPMVSHEETSMYTRSFGELPAEISRHAVQAVQGLQENRVIATGKHFINHSTAPGDEHFFLTVNDDDEETVREAYLPPFASAIKAGLDMIMMTHSVYTAWEDRLPSVFSHAIVTGLLRGELGFRGLIVTDDINMAAITLHEWDEHPDVMAIAAGVDMIVDCGANSEPIYGLAEGNRKHAFDVEGQIEAVAKAVRDGRLSEERIDESVGRILRMKMKYCLFQDPYVDVASAGEKVRTELQIETSARLHDEAITLVRNDEGLFPLDPADKSRIHVIAPAFFQLELYPDAAWGNIAGTDLFREMKKIKPAVTGNTFLVGSSPIDIDNLVQNALCTGPDLLIIGTYNALYYDQQIDLVRRLLDLGIPAIAVATAMPYDLMAFPEASTYLVSYSNRDMTLEAAARALFGQIEPTGRLPVSLPGLYEIGWSAVDADP